MFIKIASEVNGRRDFINAITQSTESEIWSAPNHKGSKFNSSSDFHSHLEAPHWPKRRWPGDPTSRWSRSLVGHYSCSHSPLRSPLLAIAISTATAIPLSAIAIPPLFFLPSAPSRSPGPHSGICFLISFRFSQIFWTFFHLNPWRIGLVLAIIQFLLDVAAFEQKRKECKQYLFSRGKSDSFLCFFCCLHWIFSCLVEVFVFVVVLWRCSGRGNVEGACGECRCSSGGVRKAWRGRKRLPEGDGCG